MERTRLADGLDVSRLGLGTGYFGTRIDRAAGERMLDRFIDADGTLVDTADCYGRGVLRPGVADAGASERLLGELLRGRRHKVILASKVGQRVIAGAGADKVGLSRRAIQWSVEASLRRLRTDTIDLYQCHLSDPQTPVDETLGALDDLVQAGKIRAVGVSNWDGWEVVDGCRVAERDGLAPIVSNQVWYNLADRRIENAVTPAMQRVGVAVIAYSALAGGFLTGSYRKGDARPAPGERLNPAGGLIHTSWDGLATDRGWRIVERVGDLAEAYGRRPSSIALRWMLDASAAQVALIGPRTVDELDAFLETLETVVAVADLDELTALSEPEATYPRSFTEAYSHPGTPLYGGLLDLGYDAVR